MSDFKLQNSELLKENAAKSSATATTLFEDAYSSITTTAKQTVLEHPYMAAAAAIAVAGALTYATRGRWLGNAVARTEAAAATTIGQTEAMAATTLLSTERSVGGAAAAHLSERSLAGSVATQLGEKSIARLGTTGLAAQLGEESLLQGVRGLETAGGSLANRFVLPNSESLISRTTTVRSNFPINGMANVLAAGLAGSLATATIHFSNSSSESSVLQKARGI